MLSLEQEDLAVTVPAESQGLAGRLGGAAAAQTGLAAGLLRRWFGGVRRLPAMILATALVAGAAGAITARADVSATPGVAGPRPVTATTGPGRVGLPVTGSQGPRSGPPAAVLGLTGVGGAGTARLCWQPAQGAAEYVLDHRDVTAGEDWVRMAYPIKGECYTVQQLLDRHSYEFRVVGSNSAGDGPPSNTVTVTSVRPLPGPVTGLTGTGGAGIAQLCWQAAAGANRYVLDYRDVTAGASWTTMPYPIETTCYTVRDLLNAHTYEFRIVGSNSAGNGVPSNVVTVTAQRPPPGPVTGLTAIAGSTTADLCWQRADNAAEYVLNYRDVTAGAAWTTMPYPIRATCYTVQQLLNGHTYEFRVVASNSVGNSAPSNTVTATPAA